LQPSSPAFDGTQPLVLSTATRFAAVPLIARRAFEQFAATPVRTHGQSIDVDGNVVIDAVVAVLVIGSSCGADVPSEPDGRRPLRRR